jgi:hypothetical protein
MLISAIGRGTVGHVVIGLLVSVERIQELLSVFPISDEPMEFGSEGLRFTRMGIPRSMHSKCVAMDYRLLVCEWQRNVCAKAKDVFAGFARATYFINGNVDPGWSGGLRWNTQLS